MIKYDRDLRTASGTLPEAQRIRALESLMDAAGQSRITQMQRVAESTGQELTYNEVMTCMDKMFGYTSQTSARTELKALVPKKDASGRVTGVTWRIFAENFRDLCQISTDISEGETREHLLLFCLNQQQAGAVFDRERRLAENPRVLLTGMSAVPPKELRQWLSDNNVEVRKITAVRGGQVVTLERDTELVPLMRLNGATVEVNGKDERIALAPIASTLTTHEILDLVSQKFADEEKFRDGQTAALAMSTAQAQKFTRVAKIFQEAVIEEEYEAEEEWLEEPEWHVRTVTEKPLPKPAPTNTQPPRSTPQGEPSGKGKGKGKGFGKGGGKGATQGSSTSCMLCGGSHWSSECPTRVCLTCTKTGHYYWECPRGGPGANQKGAKGDTGKGKGKGKGQA
jgi:hypothetical protein